MGYNELNLNESHLRIFPNPVKDILSLEMDKNVMGVLEIFNSQGRIVLQKDIQSESDLQVDVDDLPSGFYILTVISSEDIYFGKFLKK